LTTHGNKKLIIK